MFAVFHECKISKGTNLVRKLTTGNITGFIRIILFANYAVKCEISPCHARQSPSSHHVDFATLSNSSTPLSLERIDLCTVSRQTSLACLPASGDGLFASKDILSAREEPDAKGPKRAALLPRLIFSAPPSELPTLQHTLGLSSVSNTTSSLVICMRRPETVRIGRADNAWLTLVSRCTSILCGSRVCADYVWVFDACFSGVFFVHDHVAVKVLKVQECKGWMMWCDVNAHACGTCDQNFKRLVSSVVMDSSSQRGSTSRCPVSCILKVTHVTVHVYRYFKTSPRVSRKIKLDETG